MSKESNLSHEGPAQTIQVREFYNDKCIFLTGVTGFVGKVLLEKLVSSVPRLGRIYILIRARKNASAQDRLEKEIFGSEIFTILFKQRPEFKRIVHERVIAVKGDLVQKQLGIDPAVRS